MLSGSLFLENEAATEAFGSTLALATAGAGGAQLVDGSDISATLGGVIYINGELGAGKTTLVRGLMRAYGYQGAVKSPTYTIVEPYEFSGCNIYHFDLYRLADPQEVEFLGVTDYFKAQNLCLIEWSANGFKAIPEPDLVIGLATKGMGRLLSWRAMSARGQEIAEKLQGNC